MKILYQKSRDVLIICVQYDGLQYKPKNKTFKKENYPLNFVQYALDFALTLPDMYIMSCEKDIYDWAIKNKHPIINKKSWEFW